MHQAFVCLETAADAIDRENYNKAARLILYTRDWIRAGGVVMPHQLSDGRIVPIETAYRLVRRKLWRKLVGGVVAR